jgi:hypothetical protein
VPADYPPTPQYDRGILSNGSNDKILIANTDSENREAKSLIQLLESFLLSNTRNSDRAWWISTSESISVLDEEDGVRAIIPDVKVVFNIDKKENLLVEIGDLELRISQESGEGLNISVQLPSPFRLRNPNGSVAAELSFNSSQFTLNWDSELKTIIGNQFDFRDISLREKDNLIGRIERIESTGKLDEQQKGFWAGFSTFRMQNLVGPIIEIDEWESKFSINGLRLREITTAMKEIDSDGRFGSWFYGGAFYPTSMYEYALSRENIVPFIDATRKTLPALGDGSTQSLLHEISFPGLFSVTDIRAISDYHRDAGNLSTSAVVEVDGIHVSENPEYFAFQSLIPTSFKLDLNFDRIPEISLVDILRTVTIDALKENWSVMSKREEGDAILKILFSHISEFPMALANAESKVSINDTVIKAPLYEARLKGNATAEPTAKGRFLGNLELNMGLTQITQLWGYHGSHAQEST